MPGCNVSVWVKHVTSHSAFVGAVILALSALGMVVALSSVGARDSDAPIKLERPPQNSQMSDETAAEARFSDAPDGVDPMVTGPVSEAFRSQQKIAGCEDAIWPDVPLICYPS